VYIYAYINVKKTSAVYSVPPNTLLVILGTGVQSTEGRLVLTSKD